MKTGETWGTGRREFLCRPCDTGRDPLSPKIDERS